MGLLKLLVTAWQVHRSVDEIPEEKLAPPVPAHRPSREENDQIRAQILALRGARRMALSVDHHRCTACGSCAESCPADAIAVAPGADHAEVDEDQCAICGACIAVCPEQALHLDQD